MTTRVLMINRQLVFAVTIKQALEQTGAFEVHAFTALDPALDFLRTHPQDVALVDFSLPTISGAEVVQKLRWLQPELAVIISPSQPNGNTLIRELNLQGIVDAPFNARTIIPLIEHAVSQVEQPLTAITRSIPPGDASAGDTEVLGNSASEIVEDMLDPRKAPRRPAPPGPTRILSDEEKTPQKPTETRRSAQEPRVTRILPDDPKATRVLGNAPVDATEGAQTRILDDKSAGPKRAASEPPGSLPEFSSLDSVLSNVAPSEMFEPPVAEGDTPAVPGANSDAVRQFLATKTPNRDEGFSQVLDNLGSEQSAAPGERSPNSFDDLVNSMRPDKQHRPLPDRQQQFIDFILTGGMDNLLTEIEMSKTGPLTPPPGFPTETPGRKPKTPKTPPPPKTPSVFEQLAEDEPPMPTLEESGTVGDLMLGVSDSGFRGVLEMMKGDEQTPSPRIKPLQQGASQRLPEDIEAAFKELFNEQTPEEPKRQVKPLRKTQAPPAPAPKHEEPAPIPAQLILETALDESTPVDSFSLDNLIKDIEQQLSEHTPEVQAPPSWGVKIEAQPRKDERYIKEPPFLAEEFPPAEPKIKNLPSNVAETLPQTLPPGPADDDDWLPWDDTGELAEEDWALPQQTQPANTLDVDAWDEAFFNATVPAEALEATVAQPAVPAETEAKISPFHSDDFDLAVDDAGDEATVMMARTDAVQFPADFGQAGDFEPQIQQVDFGAVDDPYVARIAVSLTQMSLELAAEATLLTRDGEIVAFAGDLVQADVEELRAIITGDWGAAGADDARIRFITLASSGKGFMLYSRRTVGGFTLSMIFADNTPLRDIRRQGRRLMEALEAVPEVVEAALSQSAPAVPGLEPQPAQMGVVPTVAGPVTPYAYVWLLRDANAQLSDQASRAIRSGLTMQLREQGWQIKTIEAQHEYVYLVADVPGETPAHEIVRDLQRRSGDLARAHDSDMAPQDLWADSYLIMTPGRELDPEEINDFIQFQRMN